MYYFEKVIVLYRLKTDKQFVSFIGKNLNYLMMLSCPVDMCRCHSRIYLQEALSNHAV